MGFKSLTKQIDPTTRDEILRHAQKIFAEVGFKEATIRQICKAAKANVCLVSYYFGGKEGLYKSVFKKIAEDKSSRAQKHLGPQQLNIETLEEYKLRLQIFLEEMFSEHISNPETFIIMNREMTDGLPRVSEIIENFLGVARKHFSDYLEYGRKKKFVKKNIDPFLGACTAINMIIGFTAQLSIKGEFMFPGYNQKELPDKIMKTFIPIFIDGVINHESAK